MRVESIRLGWVTAYSLAVLLMNTSMTVTNSYAYMHSVHIGRKLISIESLLNIGQKSTLTILKIRWTTQRDDWLNSPTAILMCQWYEHFEQRGPVHRVLRLLFLTILHYIVLFRTALSA